MATLDEIRKKLAAQENNQNDKPKNSGGDNASFPFWNTPAGKSTVIRFLPDADPDNTFFWVDRTVINIPFSGIVGGDNKDISVQVPCMQMYNETCPITAEIGPWWKDEELKPLARKYYRKKSYVFQGFVVNSEVEEENKPENPIRRFVINKSIFDIVKSSLMDPELEDLPIDYERGRDFKLNVTKNGEYKDYTTSSWSFKPRSLTNFEQSAVEEFGLYNLKDYLPKKPGAEELEAIVEMFHASVNGEAYDPSRWGKFYRPWGLELPDDSSNGSRQSSPKTVTKAAPKPTPKVETVSHHDDDDYLEEVVSRTETPKSTGGNSSKEHVSDILARIKNRKSS